MLEAKKKEEIIAQYQQAEGDTGSAPVQIALLTERIRGLTEHLRYHRKDFASHRGLLKLVGQRRRFLRYLAGYNLGKYQKLIAQLGLRR